MHGVYKMSSRNLHNQWLKVAHDHEGYKKETPIVIGIELYEYFGQPVKIIDVQGYGSNNPHVVVEGRFAERTTVDFEELSLLPILAI